MSVKKKKPVAQEFCTVDPDAQPQEAAPATELDRLKEKAGVVELSLSEEARLKLESYDRMAEESAKYAEQVSGLQDRIAGYIEEISALKAAAGKKKFSQQDAALRAENTGLRTESANLKAQSAGLKAENQRLKAEAARLRSDAAKARAESAAFKSENARLRPENETLKKTVDALRAELEVFKKAALSAPQPGARPMPPPGLTPNHYRRHIVGEGYSSWN